MNSRNRDQVKKLKIFLPRGKKLEGKTNRQPQRTYSHLFLKSLLRYFIRSGTRNLHFMMSKKISFFKPDLWPVINIFIELQRMCLRLVSRNGGNAPNENIDERFMAPVNYLSIELFLEVFQFFCTSLGVWKSIFFSAWGVWSENAIIGKLPRIFREFC